jgi:hypothetical protein
MRNYKGIFCVLFCVVILGCEDPNKNDDNPSQPANTTHIGKLTITGATALANKYVYVSANSPQLFGGDGFSSTYGTASKVGANGKVIIPMWEITGGTASDFKGNGEVSIVLFTNGDTSKITSENITVVTEFGTLGMKNVVFTSGVATTTYP